MEVSSLVTEGLTLMLYGMGFVFIFLTLLVIATSAMSVLVTKYEKNVGVLPEGGVPSPTAVIPQHAHPATKSHPKHDNTTLLAILSAAVNKHRSHHK
jgi:oxaloacetate decarboxylase gamma subunit